MVRDIYWMIQVRDLLQGQVIVLLYNITGVELVM